MSEPALLRTERLTRAFGSLRAVDGVDVSIRRGELRSIIGPNDAGKTTFFRLISGKIAPTSGRIWFGGRDILARINRVGTTLLLVEQTLEVALALSHRLYVMDQGRIQFEGTPNALRNGPTIQQRFLEV
jgi:ABC-type branched-subunit amino acid transport system ATPase component